MRVIGGRDFPGPAGPCCCRIPGVTAPGATSSQQIRFCTTEDGVRIAYAATGRGPVLVKTPNWLNHLELDPASPVWHAFMERLARRHTLVRYDGRGCGLSDRQVPQVGMETHMRDLDAVVAAAGLERFVLYGASQGAAIAVEYAARHPHRVSHLVLYGGFLQGARRRARSPQEVEEAQTMLKLVELGWARENSAFRQVFATQFIPDGSQDQLKAFDELQRSTVSAQAAAALLCASHEVDLTESAARVRCPTLVLHSRGDARIPFEQGRLLASAIPGAQFVPLDSRNHILLDHQPAFARCFAEIEAFLQRHGAAPPVAPAALGELTEAEVRVLDLIAAGLNNERIAQRLEIAPKTVRNHINRIFHKLGVEDRAAAIVLARNQGLGQAQG